MECRGEIGTPKIEATNCYENALDNLLRLASGIQENLANGHADGFIGPIRVLRAQRSRL